MGIFIQDEKKQTVRQYCTTPEVEKAIEILLQTDKDLVTSESQEGYEVRVDRTGESIRGDIYSVDPDSIRNKLSNPFYQSSKYLDAKEQYYTEEKAFVENLKSMGLEEEERQSRWLEYLREHRLSIDIPKEVRLTPEEIASIFIEEDPVS